MRAPLYRGFSAVLIFAVPPALPAAKPAFSSNPISSHGSSRRKEREELGKEFNGLNRRESLYLSGAGIAGMSLVGVPGLSHGQSPKYGGRLRMGERYAAAGLDPHRN